MKQIGTILLVLLVSLVAKAASPMRIQSGLLMTPATLPGTCAQGEMRFDISDAMLKVCIATNTWASSASTAPLSVGALDGQAANSSGLTIAASTLYAQSADATHPGLVNTGSQTFGGTKTFSDIVSANGTIVSLISTLADITSTQTGTLEIGSLTGPLKASSGVVSASNIDVASEVTGTLPVANGGTGRSSLTANSLLVGNGTSAVTLTSATAFGQMLVADSGGVPAWTGHPHLGDNVSYTGALDFSGATSGTITIQPQAAAGTYNFNLPVSAGTSGQPLLSGGGGSTAMTFGTLSVGGGGTGATSLTANALLLGNGTSAIQVVTPQSTQGYALQTDGSGLPIFDTTLTLGKSSAATGQLDLAGLTSGTVSIKSQDAAGTYNFNLPTTAGTAGQVLTSQGGGSSAMTWTSPLTNPMSNAGSIIYGGAAGAPTELVANSTATKKYLQSVSSGNPSWQQIAFADLSGTATIAQGGTNNGSLGVTAGGIYYGDGSKLVETGAGSANQVLISNGSSAPSWVASIASNSTNNMRLEAALISGAGSCAVTSQTGTWITGTSHTATGKCTLTITGFSAAPWCICTPQTGTVFYCVIDNGSSITSTSISTITANSLGTNTDANYIIHCFGPR